MSKSGEPTKIFRYLLIPNRAASFRAESNLPEVTSSRYRQRASSIRRHSNEATGMASAKKHHAYSKQFTGFLRTLLVVPGSERDVAHKSLRRISHRSLHSSVNLSVCLSTYPSTFFALSVVWSSLSLAHQLLANRYGCSTTTTSSKAEDINPYQKN